jgi:hypothetical protein
MLVRPAEPRGGERVGNEGQQAAASEIGQGAGPGFPVVGLGARARLLEAFGKGCNEHERQDDEIESGE